MPASSTRKAATSATAKSAVAAPAAVPTLEAASAARWFDKVSSRLDKMPLFGEALAAAALAWSESLAALSGAKPHLQLRGPRRHQGGGPAAASRRRSGLRRPRRAGLVDPGRAPVQTALSCPPSSEALFGGADEELAPGKPEGPLSAVETRIAEVVAGQAAEASAGRLRRRATDRLPISEGAKQARPPLPRAAECGRGCRIATARRLWVNRFGIDLLVPRAALDVFAERLAVLPADEPPCPDPRWCEQLEGEVSRALMSLAAVIEMQPMTLGSIAKLQPGAVLPLPRNAATNVRLLCEGKDLFRCDLGQSSGLYTVRVEEPTAELPSRKDEALAW